ncbi:Mbov_0401 family ICE element transposase-like protein [Mycoplasma seminis]|uniref:Transposase n=1 Tax=Mycoplasma seminis TaxID=512749 RepID=A0ABY9HAJ3_9MOLU|nr:hypothetical protein [Mycoplasma seminis]WLP85200.1 hypothetical protein Q8852_02660 [Mycoplasma seminis]
MKTISISQNIMQQFADNLNNEEKQFRENIRKIKHPNWKISRRITKQWITEYGTYDLNITMYEVKQNGKIIRFMYYHNEVMEQICKYKYDYDLMMKLCKKFLNGEELGTINGIKISANHIKYWIKRFEVDKDIEARNQELINQLAETKLNDENNNFEIDVDDSYSKNNMRHSRNKICMRQATMHTTTQKKLSKNGVVILLINNDKKENVFELFNKIIQQNIERFANKNSNVLWKGDGARWIRNSAKALNIQYIFDAFHMKFTLKKCLGYTKHSNNPHKKFFNNWVSTTLNAKWYDLFDYIFDNGNLQNYDDLCNILYSEMDANTEITDEIKQQINAFLRYIENNKKGIWDANGNRIKCASYTEHFVFSKCKKHIKKAQALYGVDMMKLRIMYGNLKSGYCTIFY